MTASPARLSLYAALVVFGLSLTLPTVLSAQADLGLGTWHLNLSKSTYQPGPAPKSETRVYELWEKDGVKATFTTVGADGKSSTRGYAAHFDGKDYKYTGSPDYDTIAIRRVDANTTDAVFKKAGKTVQQTTHTVISNGGKTRTQTLKGTNAKGETINNLVVFDKQ